MDIKKLIQEKRPNLKDNSLKSYLITLKKLNDNEDIENLNYLKKFDDIMEKINEYSLPTQRNKLTALLVVLSAFQKKEFDDVELKYRKELENKNKEYNDLMASHEKSDKQQANWVSLKELRKVMNQLKKTALSTQTKKGFQPYLVAALYLLQPPKRLDFSNMKVISSRKNENGKDNFLLNLGRNKKYFIFNQFKTDGKYGSKEVIVPKNINSILNQWLKINHTEDFLLNSKGEAMTSNGLGK